MHVISLKDYKAMEIFKNNENKIKNNEEVTEETIACLQLIAYTDYSEPTLEILEKTCRLIQKLKIDVNEKEAILYVLDVLSSNMLDKPDKDKFMEGRKMMINPRDEYLVNQGKLEVAKKLLPKMTIEEIIEIKGLTQEQIQGLL